MSSTILPSRHLEHLEGPGESVPQALRRLQLAQCARMASRGFAIFARIIDESPALRSKELEVMANFERVLADALEREVGLNRLDARIAATLLIGVQWQFLADLGR